MAIIGRAVGMVRLGVGSVTWRVLGADAQNSRSRIETSDESRWKAQKLLSLSRPFRKLVASGLELEMMSTNLPVMYAHWKEARRKSTSSSTCSTHAREEKTAPK